MSRPSRSAGQRACINEIAGISPAMTEKRVERIQYNRIMRPAILNPLFASLTTLPGIGPKLETLYARLLGRETPRIVDLLFHLPSGAIDRRARPKLRDATPAPPPPRRIARARRIKSTPATRPAR